MEEGANELETVMPSAPGLQTRITDGISDHLQSEGMRLNEPAGRARAWPAEPLYYCTALAGATTGVGVGSNVLPSLIATQALR